MLKHHAIYVPGLGDQNTRGQDAAVNSWQKQGVKAHYFALGWADGKSFAPKFDRLLVKIDELINQGNSVSLVGSSAGASAVINAYAKRPEVHAVILISGKINNPESIGRKIYDLNLAFKDSVYMVKESLARLRPEQIKRIMSIHPLYDGYVPVADTIIPGAVEKRVLVVGHVFGIFYTLAFRKKLITSFIKAIP